jgi:TetR/AcrR family transcriptional regulator, transcriptional repressor for nem operon
MSARDRLVTATQDLLWERGYAATSPADVQRAAGAGQGSMYHHFAGKQDLAQTALHRSAEQMRADAEPLLTGPGPALDRLERYLRRERDSLRGCRMGRMTYDPEVLRTPALLDPVADTLGWLVATVADVVRQAASAEEIDPDLDPDQLAATVVAVVQGGYVLARARQDPAPFDAAVAGAVALLRSTRR